MGSGYVIETCISAFLDSKRKRLYEDYIAECLRIITKNTATANQDGEKEYIAIKYRDIVGADKPRKEDGRTGEEIINDIKAKLGRLVGGDEEDASKPA